MFCSYSECVPYVSFSMRMIPYKEIILHSQNFLLSKELWDFNSAKTVNWFLPILPEKRPASSGIKDKAVTNEKLTNMCLTFALHFLLFTTLYRRYLTQRASHCRAHESSHPFHLTRNQTGLRSQDWLPLEPGVETSQVFWLSVKCTLHYILF